MTRTERAQLAVQAACFAVNAFFAVVNAVAGSYGRVAFETVAAASSVAVVCATLQVSRRRQARLVADRLRTSGLGATLGVGPVVPTRR